MLFHLDGVCPECREDTAGTFTARRPRILIGGGDYGPFSGFRVAENAL
jgi:hypothetical protein